MVKRRARGMESTGQEWSAPSVEALTQADGIDEAAQVVFRNGGVADPSGAIRR